jgi:hypothetical protein
MSKIYYAHFRYFDARGEISPKGGATVAFEFITPTKIKAAFSSCHEKDSFVRVIGRVKAAGRLNSEKQSFTMDLDSPMKIGDIIPLLEEVYWDRQGSANYVSFNLKDTLIGMNP